MTSIATAEQSGTFDIGDLTVRRLGYGTMQLTGPGVWGAPKDPGEAVRVIRRAYELGVTFYDTADSYGPAVAEQLLKAALHPYPADVVIATKAGLTRQGPGKWTPVGRPAYLRQQCEMSLRHLAMDQIPLYQLHRIDPEVPLADQVGELRALQTEGKIGHIGLSEVTIDELRQAQEHAPIVSVQNLYNLTNRSAEDLLDYCTEHGIGFIPWFPLATGKLAEPGGPLAEITQRLDASGSQIALSWLLHRSAVMLPIPGTSSVTHLEDNVAAAALERSDSDLRALDQLDVGGNPS